MVCNYCGRVRSDAEFYAALEDGREEEEGAAAA